MSRIITVHGTFANGPDEGESWWQRGSPFAQALAERVEAANDAPPPEQPSSDAPLSDAPRSDGPSPKPPAASPPTLALEPFGWDGHNSERSRRRAGERLYDRLLELEEAGERYALVGHSHGGSVINAALLEAARRRNALAGLSRWISVGTPFITTAKEGLLFFRLGLWGKSVYVALLSAFVLLATFAFQNFDLSAHLESWRLVGFSLLTLLTLLTPFLLFVILARLIEARRLHAHNPRTSRFAADTFRPRWLSLWHASDEAVQGLRSLKSLNFEIFARDFATPPLSVLSVFLAPALLLALASSPVAMRALVNGSDRIDLVGPNTFKDLEAFATFGDGFVEGAPSRDLRIQLREAGYPPSFFYAKLPEYLERAARREAAAEDALAAARRAGDETAMVAAEQRVERLAATPDFDLSDAVADELSALQNAIWGGYASEVIQAFSEMAMEKPDLTANDVAPLAAEFPDADVERLLATYEKIRVLERYLIALRFGGQNFGENLTVIAAVSFVGPFNTLRNAIVNTPAADLINAAGLTVNDVSFAIASLVFAIILLIFALLGTLIVSLVARLVSRTLSRSLNPMTLGQLRATAYGSDTPADYAVDASDWPTWFGKGFTPLPDVIARELEASSDAAIGKVLPKFRDAIRTFTTTKSQQEKSDLVSEYLTWDELIHTSYFRNPKFQKLVAYALAQSDGFRPSAAFRADPDFPAIAEVHAALMRDAEIDAPAARQPLNVAAAG